jgi:oxaloacetate decarboxylase gamma subunit
MSPSELLAEGWSLMAFGMGFVFLFLSALVLITTLMSKVIGRFFPELISAGSTSVRTLVSTQQKKNDTELVAAISAAIKMHRAKK